MSPEVAEWRSLFTPENCGRPLNSRQAMTKLSYIAFSLVRSNCAAPRLSPVPSFRRRMASWLARTGPTGPEAHVLVLSLCLPPSNQQTQHSRVLLKKLTVASISGNSYHFTEHEGSLSRSQDHATDLYPESFILPPYSFKIHFNIILPYMPLSLKWSLLFL